MIRPRLQPCAALLVFPLVAGCGSDDPPAGPEPLAAICADGGSRWTPGAQAFRDATADFGLDAIGAEGVRLAAVDYDGDGWPDLAVRRVGAEPDDFSAGGARQTWLLRDTGARRFEDVTQASGLRLRRADPDPDLGRPGEVIAFADVDNDGDLDAYTGLTRTTPTGGQETSEILLNQGDGTFALGPQHRVGLCLRRARRLEGQRVGALLVPAPPDRRGVRGRPRA